MFYHLSNFHDLETFTIFQPILFSSAEKVFRRNNFISITDFQMDSNSCCPCSSICWLNQILNKLDFDSHFGFFIPSKRLKILVGRNLKEWLHKKFLRQWKDHHPCQHLTFEFTPLTSDEDHDEEHDEEEDHDKEDHDDNDDHCDQLEFTPLTELDYGTFLCWATNSIGR